MDFILVSWIGFFARRLFKTLRMIVFGMAIILAIVVLKYKPAYEVTISGNSLGFIENKQIMEAKVDKYMKDTTHNIAFREIDAMPEYELKLVDRNEKDSTHDIMQDIDGMTTTTYKVYAITSDGEEKMTVASAPEAEEIINNVKEGLIPEVDLKLGIIDKYTNELNLTDREAAISQLNEYKGTKVSEYQAKKAEEERIAKEKKAKQKTKKFSTSYKTSLATTTTSAPSGSLNGMSLCTPVSGSISSRFGARGGRRHGAHTGLDIACPMGTGIRPVSSGTVVFAAYNGSYGNLIKIDHGNGVQSWYAHCSAIYVSVGQSVDSGSTIGAVGSTGNSTGPHLHLEIRINGSPVNPQNYLYR